MIYCKCGNILEQDHSTKVKCFFCNFEHQDCVIKPLVITKKYYRQESKEIEKEEGAKINYKCNKCGNNEMTYHTLQTRSADEGQTIFYACKCGYKEKVYS